MLKENIKKLMNEAELMPEDYGGYNDYYKADNDRLLKAKSTITLLLNTKQLNAKKFAEAAANLWSGRLSVKANGSLSYTAGQYWPLEVVECLADVLTEATK